MTPLKWGIILFLGGITLLGLPIGAESEAPTDQIKPSSAKECRVHIEKALEQYWDQKGPSENQNSEVEQSTNNDDDDDDESDIVTESKLEENSEDDDEDDDEDEEESETDEKQKTTTESKSNASEDDDDDDDEDNEDDDEDTTNDEDDEEEDENENKPSSLESEEEESKTKVDSESNETQQIDTDEEDEEEEEEDEDDEEEEGEDEGNGVKPSEDESDEEESMKDEISKSDEVDEDDDNDDEDDDDNDEDDEEEDKHEEKEKETDDSEEIVSNETKFEQQSESDLSPDEIKIEIQIEKDKVTGEADRASSRVESEFPAEKSPSEQPEASQVEEKTQQVEDEDDTDSDEDEDDDDDDEESEAKTINETDDNDDDSIENIYEEDEDVDSTSGLTYRSRDHIDVILGLDEIGTEYDKEEEKLAQNIFKDIKKIHLTSIKPMEMLYKYADSTTRVLTDAEIFNKPMLLFLGPWSAGKSSIINYLLGIERTPAALKTGTGVTDVDFTLITYGDQKRVMSGTELAADWRYAGVQKFGQGFLDHFRSIQIQHTLLKKITIVDTPGILENRKNADRGYSLNDAFQWFVDRSDAIYVVLDPTKVDIGSELGSVIDQLKGRDARFILNKADTIRRSDLMRVVGQLFWNLSPLMSSTEAPVIYAVSLTTKPYHPSAPAKFLADQEKNFFYDMKDTLDKRVENRILYTRRHAVRVRNHAKMVDCYLATYYRHKSIFSSKRNVAKLITENPRDYNIFDGLGGMTNVSRYDLPDPIAYKEFFKLHPLYDFKPLASTCSYFRGCPMDKLDQAISKDIPELLAKYKKLKQIETTKQEGR